MYALNRYFDHSIYNPFRELEQLTGAFWNDGSNAFSMDIVDKGEAYELSADLPGMKKEDIRLDLDKDTLTITAERHSEFENSDDNGCIRMERSYGSFSRSIDVSAIDSDRITAKYEDGVLKLNMPKRVETVPTSRRLEIA